MSITDKTDNIRLAVLADIMQSLPGSAGHTQRKRITEALVSLGSVTTYEAMRYLDCYDPRPRVHELRHQYGWQIVTIMEMGVTEAGEPHRIGRYVLVDLPPAANDDGDEGDSSQEAA